MKSNKPDLFLIIFTLLWTGFFGKLLLFGEFDLYVNPILKPLFCFGFVIFLLFSYLCFTGKCKLSFDVKYLIFLLPFLILFLTKPQVLGSKTLSNQFGSGGKIVKGGYNRISETDIKDWKVFLTDLNATVKPGTKFIWTFINDKNKSKLRSRNNNTAPDEKLKNEIIDNVNDILELPNLFNEKELKGTNPDLSFMKDKDFEKKTEKQKINLRNRRILEAIFADSLEKQKGTTQTVTDNGDRKPDYVISKGPEFYTFWSILGKKPSDYIGKKVQIKGRFFRNESDYLPNQGCISRLVITCCAAHAVPAPILIETEKINELKNDDWITATGIIDLTETKTGVQPVLKVQNTTKEPTESPYIYPKMGAELPSLNLAGSSSYKPANSFFLPMVVIGFLILTFVVMVVGDD
jgi:hypothetical protein